MSRDTFCGRIPNCLCNYSTLEAGSVTHHPFLRGRHTESLPPRENSTERREEENNLVVVKPDKRYLSRVFRATVHTGKSQRRNIPLMECHKMHLTPVVSPLPPKAVSPRWSREEFQRGACYKIPDPESSKLRVRGDCHSQEEPWDT